MPARIMGAALAATLLAGCAGIVPGGGGPTTTAQRPVVAAPSPTPLPTPSPAPSPTPSPSSSPRPSAAPSTSVPRPAPGSAEAAVITPATPGTPLPAAPVPANATTAIAAGVQAAPADAIGRIAEADAARALAAFRLSCPSVTRRTDTSGLTQPADWQAACAAAASWPSGQAARFFAEHFAPVQVGDGRAFATGYFEPEILGSRDRRPGYDYPVYAVPPDLVDIDLGTFSAALTGRRVRGRIANGTLVPYADRAAIDGGALAGRNLEIAWVADPVEFFFLQVQGSGRLRLPDGGVMRIGYAGQNGHDYVGIGRLLRDRGVLQPGQASMQGLIDYLRSQPDGGRSIMHENRSWVFFTEQRGPGPLGSLGVPVTARASVATDPMFVPLGAPVILAMDRAEATGLWIAQDIGGAIKGTNRFDTFWGEGARARAIAGGMAARGAALVLLPRASVARLTARN